MRVWPRPDSGRWLALTIGQGDKELPFELIVAVGTTEALDPTNGEIEGPPAGSLSFTARPLPAAVEAFRQGDQVH